MKATRGKIPTALWLAGALVGLLAVLALPGRWQSPALAHTTRGAEVIDTAALCNDHNLDAQGGSCPGNPDAEADAFPAVDNSDGVGGPADGDFNNDGANGFLNYDSDGDGDLDTLLVKLDQPAISIRVVAHVHDGVDDAADGTAVSVVVSGGKDVITAVSRDTNANGELDGPGVGTLTALGTAADSVVAHTVSDGPAAPCDAAGDTCIDDDDSADGGTTNSTPKLPAPDGIVIVEVTCDDDTDFTLTFEPDFPGVPQPEDSDTIRIICAEKFAISVVGLDGPPPTGDPQTVIAQATTKGSAGVGKADPDLTLLIKVVSADDTPVPGQDVDCEIDEADEDLANLDTDDNGITENSVDNFKKGLSPVGGSPGIFLLSLESQLDGAKGDVTITCWVDNDPSDNDLDTDEISDSVTVRIAGPVDTVTLDTTPAKVTAPVDLELSVQVLDNTGEGVADGTNCNWTFVPIAFPAGFLATDDETEGGKVEATLFIGSPTLLSGDFLNVSVGCGATGDKTFRVITIEVNEAGAPPPGEPGDVNKDGTIDVFDALAILLDIVGQTDLEFPENADVTGDGSTNIFDALDILGTVAGL